MRGLRKQAPNARLVISGNTWNTLVADMDARSRPPANNPREKERDDQPFIFIVGDMERESQTVVEIGDSVVVPGDVEGDGAYIVQHGFYASPSSSQSTKLAILFDGLVEEGSVARAFIIGPATVYATVHDTGHGYLAPTDTDGELESVAHPTGIQLVFAPSTGDDILCKALILGGAASSAGLLTAKLTEALLLCGSATAVLLGREETSGSESITDEECLCNELDEIIVNDRLGIAKIAYNSLGWNAPIDSVMAVKASECTQGEYDVVSIGAGCCDGQVPSTSGSEECFQPFPFEMADVPTGTPTDVAYFMAWDSDGCLIKVPASSCTQSG